MLKKLLVASLLLTAGAIAQTNLGPITVTTQTYVGRTTAGANPPAGQCETYFNTLTGIVTYVNSAGGNCAPGTGGGAGFGVSAANFSGADPCLQIQNAIYSSPAGSIINATSFSLISVCSVNPFQAPSQSSPVNFAGLPVGGELYMNGIAVPGDLPFFVPNKWTVHGAGGYGTNRTTIQPSATFLANRTVIAAVGGASGCSSSGGTTVTISGTAIPTPANLIGMFVLCSSNASSTAIPTPKNAQIGGVITAVSGSGPYILTLGGAGAAGTVANTGFTINPIIAGWQPNSQVFGSTVDQVTSSCSTPASGNVIGCIPWMVTTANEHTLLSSFTALNFDFMGIGIFTAQAQNWGPFVDITLNSSTTGNNNTIGVELGGTGWNANGGGVSGLCATGNPCALGGSRGIIGLTDTGSGTGAGDGGIGIDVNGANLQIISPHFESMKVGVLIGDSAPAQNIKVSNATGCTNSGCALTSTVDISATYASGSAPAPTQNILIETAARNFSSTWDVRDFIHLLGITSDPTVGTYSIGSSGAAGQLVYHTAQQPSCITSGGVLDTNGAHCAPGIQMQIVSKLNGTYYADSWNNNGSADVCAQINNTMQWVAQVQGITNGVFIDASGFNRNSGYPCATNPFAGTLGTTIPAGGLVKFGLAKLFFSTQWIVPANWILAGMGGNGIGAAGASGTLFSPNINNTANANYANDSTVGTVTTTAGSYTVVGSGTGWTSALIGHYFMACATLPCTTQALMTGGIVTAVGSGTSLTLDVPAQASVAAGGNYTVTAPLIQNAGILRDVGIDGNSYGTGGGNGNGGFVGVYQVAGAAGGSYLDNVSIGHVNATGIDASGLNNLKLNNVSVTGNAIASSVFTCLTAPQGIDLSTLGCQSGTTPNPTLSYGVMSSGSGFKMEGITCQNVAVCWELAVNPGFATNNVTGINIKSGSGATAVTTLVDLGTVTSGGNRPGFSVDLHGMQCPSGCSNIVKDTFSPYTLTDATLNQYTLSRTDGNGNRTLFTDSSTSGVPRISYFGTSILGTGTVSNSDRGGTLTFTASTTSTSYTFAGPPGGYVSPPWCTFAAQGDQGANRIWISTLSNTTLQLTASGAVTVTVQYQCTPTK